jgi:D-3-phosphoglycerate dehydrogenase / 2-oxoglutarate reductase
MTAPASADLAMNLLLSGTDPSRPATLSGKVLGLIGYGVVGREIARRAARRGMKVVYTDDVLGRGPHQRVQLGELLRSSDFIMPVNGHAKAFNRAELVALMKPGARLVEP